MPPRGLEFWQDDGLLLLVFSLFVGVGDFALFVSLEEQDLSNPTQWSECTSRQLHTFINQDFQLANLYDVSAPLLQPQPLHYALIRVLGKTE
jgi:hypothetical protein